MHSANQAVPFYPSWVDIDLEAIVHNHRLMRRQVGTETLLFHVVKSNAYGHGLVPVSRCLMDAGSDGLCVARLWEAAELRQAGLTAPILCLTSAFPEEAPQVVALDLEISLFRPEPAQALSAAAVAAGRPVKVHLKVDTGMGRLGVAPDEALAFARFLKGLPGLEVHGLMSHLSSADDEDETPTRKQLDVYSAVYATLREHNLAPPVGHLGNSDGTMRFAAARRQLARPGMATYGCYPSDWYRRHYTLRPAMAVRSRLASVRALPAGTSLSYSRMFVTARDSVIGVVQTGYADGFMRAGMGKAQMLVQGRRVPVLGRICMEQSLVDLTDVAGGCAYGDVVTVMGCDGDEAILAEEIAAWWGTINYEVTPHLGRQFPKVYRAG